MAGRAVAVTNGTSLTDAVVRLGEELELEVHEQVEVARRLWGARRRIDVILIHPQTRKTLGVECKYQDAGGSAEEKIPATIQDITAWPMDGLVVYAGSGFSENMKSYLLSTGKAVEVSDLEPWLRLYFGLPIPHRPARRLARKPKPPAAGNGTAAKPPKAADVEEMASPEPGPAQQLTIDEW